MDRLPALLGVWSIPGTFAESAGGTGQPRAGLIVDDEDVIE